MAEWKEVERPGFFGRRRDQKIADLNNRFGEGNWKLAHVVDYGNGQKHQYHFFEACRMFYEESYWWWFLHHPEALEHITSFGECYDNELNNIESGLDYMVQRSFSTHIQDIAVRNCLRRFETWFKGDKDYVLQIRGTGEGARYNPGRIPYKNPELITQPSLRPTWADEGSVEDFWQSNKWVLVKVPEERKLDDIPF